LHLADKKLGEIKLVTSGAGAAAIACLNQLVALGLKPANVWVTDIEGVVYEGRSTLMDPWKSVYAQKTDKSAYRLPACSSRKWPSAWPSGR
jgi:malate dehydrogenase (oxaloacetate-decarboxylating)(NADP+)